MKRKIALLIISILTVSVCFAQNDDDRWKKRYINLGFINNTMSREESPDLKSNYGASFITGRIFYLNKAHGGALRFGIDITWFDLNYTNYKIKHVTNLGTDNYQFHQGEVSMHIGPSFTINPGKKWNIHFYFRYAPSYSVLYAKNAFYGNYATYFVGGASISCGVMGLGFESRYGDCKYKGLGPNSEEGKSSFSKTKYDGWKAYLTFRF